MPIIPFLILTAKVAGGVGAVLSGDAISKNRQAKNINVGASARYDFAKESTEYAQAKANTSIENLGELKLRILDTTVKNYIEIFEKIHNLELSNIDLLTNDICFDNEIIIKMRELNANAHSVLSGIAAGVGAGITVCPTVLPMVAPNIPELFSPSSVIHSLPLILPFP